jgi:hypothetical protein
MYFALGFRFCIALLTKKWRSKFCVKAHARLRVSVLADAPTPDYTGRSFPNKFFAGGFHAAPPPHGSGR